MNSSKMDRLKMDRLKMDRLLVVTLYTSRDILRLDNMKKSSEIDDIFADAHVTKNKKRKISSTKTNNDANVSEKKQTTSEIKQKKSTQKKLPKSESLQEPQITHDSSSYGIIKSDISAYTIISPEAPLERIDKASGLPVYKAHLLKVGDGGGTPLCPFDCDCCF